MAASSFYNGMGEDTYNAYNFTEFDSFSVNFYVDRAVTNSSLNADGTLVNPQEMIAKGLIAPTVTVQFAMVDFKFYHGVCMPRLTGSLPLHLRLISVNGKLVENANAETPGGWLKFDHSLVPCQYCIITYKIPIAMVRFPLPAQLGSTPEPVLNTLDLSDDFLGFEGVRPKRHVAWSMTSVSAAAPIVFVHGMATQGVDWGNPATSGASGPNWYGTPGVMYQNILDLFNASLGTWSTSINLGTSFVLKSGVQSISSDSTELQTQLPSVVNTFGARKCHVVAHSKGGLDMRYYLDSTSYRQQLLSPGGIKVLSLYTIDTPHKGSVLADIMYHNQREYSDQNIKNILLYTPWYKTFFAPTSDAIRDLQIDRMASFNIVHSLPPTGCLFYNFAGDADWNGDGVIGYDPTCGIGSDATYRFEPYGQVDDIKFQALLGTAQYKILRNVNSISYTQSDVPGLGNISIPFRVVGVSEVNAKSQPNDLMVTQDSASPDPQRMLLPVQKANHGTIKSVVVGQAILDQIKRDFPNS